MTPVGFVVKIFLQYWLVKLDLYSRCTCGSTGMPVRPLEKCKYAVPDHTETLSTDYYNRSFQRTFPSQSFDSCTNLVFFQINHTADTSKANLTANKSQHTQCKQVTKIVTYANKTNETKTWFR